MNFYKVPDGNLFIGWGPDILTELGFEKQERTVDLDKDGYYPLFNIEDLITDLTKIRYGKLFKRTKDSILFEHKIDTYFKLKHEYIKIKMKDSAYSKSIRNLIEERYEEIKKLQYGNSI